MVGVEQKNRPGRFRLSDSLDELGRLAETAGVQVVGRLTQAINHPHPATYIGSGKLEELISIVREQQIDIIIFDDELSPRQQREIEKASAGSAGLEDTTVKVLDRTALILDIFAQHAHTREGALQVELAQYQYRLPRLTRAWTHLARQAGGRAGGATGGVGVRGPGETQLEIDRREIGRRIAFLQRELEDVRVHREQYRSRRRQSYTPLIALVGYTNAGKSTLLNALTNLLAGRHADALAVDQLFATLDPVTRRLVLPSGREALLTDTVGFIQKLPTQLVAAFRATLEEILEADLLLHVADIAHPNVEEQIATVDDVLAGLGAADIPTLVVYNKIDALPEKDGIAPALPAGISISALTGHGLPELAEQLDLILSETMMPIEVLIPYKAGEMIDLIHRFGIVMREAHQQEGTFIEGRIPRTMLGHFRLYVQSLSPVSAIAPDD